MQFSYLIFLSVLLIENIIGFSVTNHAFLSIQKTTSNTYYININNKNRNYYKSKNNMFLYSKDDDNNYESAETGIILSLSSKGCNVFDNASPSSLDVESFEIWERELDTVQGELRLLSNPAILLAVYSSILAKASPKLLDAIELASFELLSNAIVDSLLRQLTTTTVTDIVDQVTQIHLDYVEEFVKDIEDGGSDGYSQSASSEELVYQFAGLARKVYSRIAIGLGAEYDTQASTNELRLNKWVTPVYARLQRRFVRFIGSNVEERLELLDSAAVDTVLARLPTSLSPKPHPRYIIDTMETSLLSTTLPSWEVASLIIKVLRMISSSLDMVSIEAKIGRTFQNDISERMILMGRPLENIAINLMDQLRRNGDNNSKDVGQIRYILSTKEKSYIENMLHEGHALVAATLALFHIRSNIVGTIDPRTSTGSDTDQRNKEFISPMILWSDNNNINLKEKSSTDETSVTNNKVDDDMVRAMRYPDHSVLVAMPKSSRPTVDFTVAEVADRLKPTKDQISASLLGHAVRFSTAENFRALITYGASEDQWPRNRDSTFIASFASVVTNYILAEPDAVLNGNNNDGPRERVLYENMIALCALEEAIGVREPRAACAKALGTGIHNAFLAILDDSLQNNVASATPVSASTTSESVSKRIHTLEIICGMMMQLPEGMGLRIRKKVLSSIAETAIELSNQPHKIGEWTANALCLDPSLGKRTIAELGEIRFDRKVGNMLMTTDIGDATFYDANIRKDLSQSYQESLFKLSQDLNMKEYEVNKKLGLITGAIFGQIVEMALEEENVKSRQRVLQLLKKSKDILMHPLLDNWTSSTKATINSTGDDDKVQDLKDIGVTMSVARLGKNRIMEILKMLDNAKGSLSGNDDRSGSDGGWGINLSDEDKANILENDNEKSQLYEYVEQLQKKYLIEYASAGVRER